MELQHLPRQVLVQPDLAAQTRRAVRPNGLGLVELKQHGGVLLGGDGQIFEPPEQVRLDGLTFVLAHEDRRLELCRRGREDIGPEESPPLGEAGLPGRAQRPGQGIPAPCRGSRRAGYRVARRTGLWPRDRPWRRPHRAPGARNSPGGPDEHRPPPADRLAPAASARPRS